MARLRLYLRREWLSVILAMILGALSMSCLWGPLRPQDLLVLRRDRVRLTLTRDQLLADNHRLHKRIIRLRADDVYLQQLIRQELGYVRPDEFVYRFAQSQPR